ncbi:MAG: hypothetical protein Q9199_003320 [Rusavskia elegans]
MDRPQLDSNTAIQKLIKWVQSTKDRGMRCAAGEESVYNWDVPYVSRTALEDYFGQDHAVDNLLQALYSEDGSVLEALDAGHIKKKYSMVFCLLIVIGHGRFINYFVEHGIDDQRLPLHDQRNFPTTASDPQFFGKFYQQQWQFCVPDLDADICRTFDHREWIIPIRRMRTLGDGGSAHVYKIEVHGSYNKLERGGSHDSCGPHPNIFVLKSYRNTVDAEKYYDNEWKALKRVHSPAPSPHIVRFFGRFILGGVYNILLEYADMGTLEDYLAKTPPPCTAKDIIDFWRSILSVTWGLHRIHNSTHSAPSGTDGPRIFQGWHHDIKPPNLLVKSQRGGSAYNFECKLADLGLSHFKRSRSWQRDSVGKDAYGTRTYGAPECFRDDNAIFNEHLSVRQSVDVWSLGCVLSEAATWVACNWNYVDEYRAQRRMEIKKMVRFRENDDFFHNGDNDLLETVSINHANLVDSVRPCDFVTKEVIKMISDDMLRPSELDARRNARYLVNQSELIIKGAKKKLEKTADRFTSAGPAAQSINLQSPTEGVLIPPDPVPWNFDPPAQPPYNSDLAQRQSVIRNGSQSNDVHSRPASHTPREQQPTSIQGTYSEHQDNGGDLQRTLPYPDRAETLPPHASRPSGTQHVSSMPGQFQSSMPYRRRPESYNGWSVFNDPGHQLGDNLGSHHAITNPSTSTQANVFSAQTNGVVTYEQAAQSPPTVHIPQQRHWSLEDALHWKRAKKDPNNRERVHIPSEYRMELEGLNKRDHAFLVDNSSSMLTYWTKARDLLDVLGYIVKDKDPNGVDLYFTCPFKKFSKIKRSSQLIDLFDRHKPTSNDSLSDMNASLSEAIADYQDIVDTEPVNGNLGKILFGAVNAWFDDDDEPSNGLELGSPSAPKRSAQQRSSAYLQTPPRT